MGVMLNEVQHLGGQRVLVTGAGGQLGRYLVPELRRSGATVIAFGLGGRRVYTRHG